jgi:hypothetical protein
MKKKYDLLKYFSKRPRSILILNFFFKEFGAKLTKSHNFNGYWKMQ